MIESKNIENIKNYEISKKIKNNDIKSENKMITPKKNIDNASEKLIDDEMENLIYLKKLFLNMVNL